MISVTQMCSSELYVTDSFETVRWLCGNVQNLSSVSIRLLDQMKLS